MGLEAKICFRLPEALKQSELDELNNVLAAVPEDFDGIPIERIVAEPSFIDIILENGDVAPVNAHDYWYDVNLIGPYSGPSYPKSGIIKYLRIAETIAARLPRAEIYYGDFEHPLESFGKTEREEFRDWAKRASITF